MTEPNQARTATEMMMAAVVIFCMIFLMFFYLYLHIIRPAYIAATSSNRRSPLGFILSPDQRLNGLDPTVIAALPITTFQSVDFKDGLECAVCLCELSEGEAARLLPKCSHGFHVECIDKWLQSNNSCPLCRSLVSGAHIVEIPPVESSSEQGDFPANVLVWGNRDQVNSGPSVPTMAEIGIGVAGPLHRIRVAGGSPLPRLAREDIRSSALARLRSLQELLSLENREIDSSWASSPDSPSLRELLSRNRRDEWESNIPGTPNSP